MTAKVSIIVGVYNCEDTLPEALDSILAQTFVDWEMILCDDASSDNTYQVAEEYQKRFPNKIKLLKNKNNLRLAATLNRCAKVACGKYLARMDGDDISMINRLEMQVNFLDGHPEYAIVGTYMQAFDEKGDRNIISVRQKPCKYDLAKMTPFNHATVLIRKSVFEALGGYHSTELTERCEDVDLWFRFFAAGYQGYNLTEPLYRVREDRTTFKRRSWKSSFQASLVVWRGIRMLGLPWYYSVYTLKPVVSQLTPIFIKRLFRLMIHKGNI